MPGHATPFGWVVRDTGSYSSGLGRGYITLGRIFLRDTYGRGSGYLPAPCSVANFCPIGLSAEGYGP